MRIFLDMMQSLRDFNAFKLHFCKIQTFQSQHNCILLSKCIAKQKVLSKIIDSALASLKFPNSVMTVERKQRHPSD